NIHFLPLQHRFLSFLHTEITVDDGRYNQYNDAVDLPVLRVEKPVRGAKKLRYQPIRKLNPHAHTQEGQSVIGKYEGQPVTTLPFTEYADKVNAIGNAKTDNQAEHQTDEDAFQRWPADHYPQAYRHYR